MRVFLKLQKFVVRFGLARLFFCTLTCDQHAKGEHRERLSGSFERSVPMYRRAGRVSECLARGVERIKSFVIGQRLLDHATA